MKEQLYMMDAGYSMSSWGKWQRKIFDFAKQYDHHLFTEDGEKFIRGAVGSGMCYCLLG